MDSSALFPQSFKRAPLRAYLPDLLQLFLISGLSVALDQATKAWVRVEIPIGSAWGYLPDLFPYARLVHWKNYGAAFGMFQNGGMIFSALAVLVALVITNYYPTISRKDHWLRFALALQMGGALGNLIDRVRQGWVTDFISILNLPVFNLADLSITIGVILIFIPMLLHLRRDWPQMMLRRAAREIGARRRKKSLPASLTDEEPLSLGLAELALHRFPKTVGQALKLEAQRMRHHHRVQRRLKPKRKSSA